MRFIKLAIISIVFFAIILTGFSLLLPSTINISRAIDINASPEKIHSLVNNLNNWSKWYVNADSINWQISTKSGGTGANMKNGTNEVAIVSANDSTINVVWKTSSEGELPGQFNIITNNNSSVTTVQWRMVHKVKWYPWEKFASIVADKSMGPFMEKSLDQLKASAEKQ